MSHYPVQKLLDLAQAARRVQEDASPANVETFENLLRKMRAYEEVINQNLTDGIDMLPQIRSQRVANLPTPNALTAGGSIIFDLHDFEMTVSLYRENIPGSFRLYGDVTNHHWSGATVLLYQADNLIDADFVDIEGDFILTALESGKIHVELRHPERGRINLMDVELTS